MTYVFTQEQIVEIEKAINDTKNAKTYKKLEVIYLRSRGKRNKEIAEITGYKRTYVSELVSKYMRIGISGIISEKRIGNNRKLTIEEEKEFLKPFYKKGESGQIITVSEIRTVYEKITGEKIAKSTIYYVLHRNEFRKVMPRSKHPKKASDEAIEAYKKNQNEH